MAIPSTHRLIVDSICKSYQDREVIKSVSFEVSSGDIVGLLGPNGAGKTTCFYIASGLLKPDLGKVLLDDRNITNLPLDRRALLGIGYLAQEPSIFRTLTVAQNILSALELSQLSGEQKQSRLGTILDEFKLTHIKNSKGISLSGGERRRVEIARITAIRPKFILLDEPFSGVDPIAVKDLQQLIFALGKKGIGLLMTDHNFREMLDTCQTTYVLSEGRIIAFGDKQTILTCPAVKTSYLGSHSHYE